MQFLWDYPHQSLSEPPSFDPSRASLLRIPARTSMSSHGRNPAPAQLPGGYFRGTFYLDFYEHLHVSTTAYGLGNLVGEQRRNLWIWNGYRRARILGALTIDNADGITLIGQPQPPMQYAPQQQKHYTLIISPEGPATIDATITFTFDGQQTITTRITGSRVVGWGWAPDWGDTIRERLSWLTELLRARTGIAQRRKLRQAPRRSFEFDVIVDAQDRRTLDATLFDWSSRVFALPIFPDVRFLLSPISAGTSVIDIDTAGLDFQPGKMAMLWHDSTHYEVVQVAEVRPDRIVLASPTLSSWPIGSRLYPARSARLQSYPSLTLWHDDAARSRVSFTVDEPCDWSPDAPATMYRGFPVLDLRPEMSDGATARYQRITTTLDEQTGPIAVLDRPGKSFREDGFRQLPVGRVERDVARRWAYYFAGRYRLAWVPSWSSDLRLTQPTSASDSAIIVEWTGYSRFGRAAINRRDVRIELHDGTTYYRRIIGYGELDGGDEQLTLDSPLGQRVDPDVVRAISFMTLASLATDDVDIEHVTDADGLARMTLQFAGEIYDVV